MADTRLLMLTVYEDSDHIYNALEAGACGYLLKQTPRSELLATLRDVHRGGSPMTSNITHKVVQSFQRETPRCIRQKAFHRGKVKYWNFWRVDFFTRK